MAKPYVAHVVYQKHTEPAPQEHSVAVFGAWHSKATAASEGDSEWAPFDPEPWLNIQARHQKILDDHRARLPPSQRHLPIDPTTVFDWARVFNKPGPIMDTPACTVARQNVITGTEAATLAGVNPYSERDATKDGYGTNTRKWLLDKKAGIIHVNYENDDMRRGKAEEQEAGELFESLTGLRLARAPIGFIEHASGLVGASPDRRCELAPLLIEIKSKRNRFDFKVPINYWWQMQMQMASTGIHNCVLFQYISLRAFGPNVMIPQCMWHLVQFNQARFQDFLERFAAPFAQDLALLKRIKDPAGAASAAAAAEAKRQAIDYASGAGQRRAMGAVAAAAAAVALGTSSRTTHFGGSGSGGVLTPYVPKGQYAGGANTGESSKAAASAHIHAAAAAAPGGDPPVRKWAPFPWEDEEVAAATIAAAGGLRGVEAPGRAAPPPRPPVASAAVADPYAFVMPGEAAIAAANNAALEEAAALRMAIDALQPRPAGPHAPPGVKALGVRAVPRTPAALARKRAALVAAAAGSIESQSKSVTKATAAHEAGRNKAAMKFVRAAMELAMFAPPDTVPTAPKRAKSKPATVPRKRPMPSAAAAASVSFAAADPLAELRHQLGLEPVKRKKPRVLKRPKV